MEKSNYGFIMYGRVWRVLTPELVLVVDCGKYIALYHPDDLELANDYRGYWDGLQHGADRIRRQFPIFRPMPSLRKLKTAAAWYAGPDVWQKKRCKGRACPDATHGRGRYNRGNIRKEYMVPTDL